MPRKGENIYGRRDGHWEARYVKGYEASGGIRYGVCHGRTRREARAKAERARAVLLGARSLQPGGGARRRRFAFYCEEWLRMQRTAVKESSYVKYESALQCHILPQLGDCYPQDLSTQCVEMFKAALLDEGLCVQSVKNLLMILHAILRHAAAEYPGVFPAADIRYPKEPKREPRVLAVEEQQRFVAYLQTDMDACKFGILLALMTGLRIGEICALQWKSISLRSNTIQISATMQRIRDLDADGTARTKILIGKPKSETSARTIPLPKALVALCRHSDPHRPDAYVLTGTDAYMEPRKLQRRLKQYTQDCGLDGVHFHTLRHTFATRCMEAGFEIKSLSEIMGHARTSTTLDRYVHSSLEVKRDNMAKLALAGKGR